MINLEITPFYNKFNHKIHKKVVFCFRNKNSQILKLQPLYKILRQNIWWIINYNNHKIHAQNHWSSLSKEVILKEEKT